MTPRRWKWGLVGVGRGSGYGHLVAADPRCEVVACCDTSERALARFQEELALSDSRCFRDYDDLLSSTALDAALIGTPIPVHAEQTVKALEAGVNVLCEVTAAGTLEECERIVAAVRRTGRIYMLAENCCFWPFVQEWQELVRAGRLGEICYAECEYFHPIPELLVDAAGGRLWRAERPPLHYCSHSLGPILEITGDRITRAMGIGGGHRMLPDCSDCPGAIDLQVALFETARGAIVKLARTSVLPRHPMIHYYTLQGTKGFVETDRLGPSGGLLYLAGEMERARHIETPLVDESLPAAARSGGHGTAEYGVMQAFLQALETGTPPRLDAVRAMDLTAPGLVAHASALSGGEWLEVPSFG